MEARPIRHPEDCERIQRACASVGCVLSLEETQTLWEQYSETMSAGWLVLPDDDANIVARLRGEGLLP
jgi:hypothetical protein